MVRIAAPAVCIFLCASAFSAPRRDPSAPPRDQVFRATADTVAVYATVRDRDGRLQLGLSQDDFEIRDNGKLRPITVFSSAEQPITIGLLLDRSGSMSARFEAVAAAASAFVDKLTGPDRASLSLLNWDCAPLTSDRALLKRLLADVMPTDFGSAIWDGLDRVLGSLEPEPGRRAALLFSDGLNSGVTNFNRDMWPTQRGGCRRMPPVSDATLKDLSRRADREGFLIYAISAASFGPTSGDSDLRALARDSGGERFRLERDDELKEAFTRIADELHHQYLLGFVPAEFDGKTHEIDVRVKGAGLEVRARRRYVAVREGGAAAASAEPAPIAPLDDAAVQEAVAQGLQGTRVPKTRFDLAAFRALPAGDVEAIVAGFGVTGRCRISEKDRAQVR